MPWIENRLQDPKYYALPRCRDNVMLGTEEVMAKAKSERKDYTKLKDVTELPKWLRAEHRQTFRAWDFVVKYFEAVDGYCSYPYRAATKEGAKEIDTAFRLLELTAHDR